MAPLLFSPLDTNHTAPSPPLSPPAATTSAYELQLIGVMLIIFGSFSSSVGLLLMKRSSSTEVGIPIWRKKYWLAGFFFLVINATVIDLIAFSLTPLSLIAPFAGMTIVFSALLASTGLLSGGEKEVIGRVDVLVIGIILLGVTTVSLVGPRSPEGDPPDMDTMLTYFYNPPFVAFSLSSAVVIFSFVLTQCFVCGRVWLNRFAVLKTFCNGFTAAGCGALSQMCLKIVATALRETFNGRPALTTLAFWASVFGLAAFAPLQLVLLNSTLANSPVSYAVPLYQTMLIVLTIVAGGTFFLEFGSMDILHGVLFGVGVLLAILGLVILSLRKQGDVLVQSERHAQKAHGGMLDAHNAHGAREGESIVGRGRRSDENCESPLPPRLAAPETLQPSPLTPRSSAVATVRDTPPEPVPTMLHSRQSSEGLKTTDF